MTGLEPIILRIAGSAAVACLLVFGGCRWQASNDSDRIQAAEARADTLQAKVDELAQATKDAEDKAEAASNKLDKAAKEADERYADLERKATRDAAALAAALRSGKQRLSDTWTCPATAGAGDHQPDAGSAAAARRADSAARIVAAADADAAAMNWLYDRWAAEHRAVIAAGCAVESQE